MYFERDQPSSKGHLKERLDDFRDILGKQNLFGKN